MERLDHGAHLAGLGRAARGPRRSHRAGQLLPPVGRGRAGHAGRADAAGDPRRRPGAAGAGAGRVGRARCGAAARGWTRRRRPRCAQARELLRRLEALDAAGAITATGSRHGSSTGLHPRLAHLLVRARGTRVRRWPRTLAALLSERDLLRAPRDPDMRTRLELLRGDGARASTRARWRACATCAPTIARSGGARCGRRRAAPARCWPGRIRIAWRSASRASRAARARASATCWPTAAARCSSRRSTLAGSPYLVALDLDDAEGAEARIRLAAPLTREQLEMLRCARRSARAWRPIPIRAAARCARGACGAWMRWCWTSAASELDPQAMPRCIAGAAARAAGSTLLPWGEAARALRARLRFVADQRAAARADWPACRRRGAAGAICRSGWRPGCRASSGWTSCARASCAEALLSRLHARAAQPARRVRAHACHRAHRLAHRRGLRGRQRALHRGAHAGSVRPGRHAAHRRRHACPSR